MITIKEQVSERDGVEKQVLASPRVVLLTDSGAVEILEGQLLLQVVEEHASCCSLFAPKGLRAAAERSPKTAGDVERHVLHRDAVLFHRIADPAKRRVGNVNIRGDG
jgi:hypothetical protein